jgi:hypothetical protein
MLEINRLYRIIGRCEQQLARLQNPEPASPGKTPRLLDPYAGGALLLLAVLVLYESYKRRTQ